jgi:hypothetical protein
MQQMQGQCEVVYSLNPYGDQIKKAVYTKYTEGKDSPNFVREFVDWWNPIKQEKNLTVPGSEESEEVDIEPPRNYYQDYITLNATQQNIVMDKDLVNITKELGILSTIIVTAVPTLTLPSDFMGYVNLLDRFFNNKNDKKTFINTVWKDKTLMNSTTVNSKTGKSNTKKITKLDRIIQLCSTFTDTDLKDFEGYLNDYKDELSKNKKVRPANIPLMPIDENTATITSKYTALLMGIKDAYQLGALTGPDMSLVESQLTNPASISGAITSRDAMKAQVDVLEGILKRSKENLESSYGKKMDLGVAKSSNPTGAPTGAPPDAKQAPDGNWYSPDPKRPGKYLQWSK